MINIQTQKTATLSCLQHTNNHFPDVRQSIVSLAILISVISNGKALSFAVSNKKQDNNSLFEFNSYYSSIIVIEFQMADNDKTVIVCQGN